MAKFKDKVYQKTFEDIGFNYTRFLNNEELLALKSLFAKKIASEVTPGLYFSQNAGNGEFSISISDQIEAILKNALARTFEDYSYFYGCYSVKQAHFKEEFELHQDWNIVDEKQYANIQLWIPLELSYPENGGMFFLPYSHKFWSTYRSGNFDVPHINRSNELDKLISPVRLLPQDAVVFNSSTFHGSYANESPIDRVAVLVCLHTKNAPTYYYSKDSENNCTQRYHFSAKEMLLHLSELMTGKGYTSLLKADTLPMPEMANHLISQDLIIEKFNSFSYNPESGAYIRPKARRIIKSDEIEQQINDQGYAVVQFLNNEEIAQLSVVIQEHLAHKKEGPARIVSNKDEPHEIRIKSFDFILKACNRSISHLFYDCVPEGSLFYIKRSGIEDNISIHFNPTLLLNEHLEMQLGIWCPIIDTDENNGGIQVIPGSHRWGNYLSGTTLGNMFWEHNDYFTSLLQTIPLKAGEAIIWDDRIAHSSNDNNSGKDRLGIALRFVHKDARIVSLFKDENAEEITVYEQDIHWKKHPDWDDAKTRPKIGKIEGVIYNYHPNLEDCGFTPTKLSTKHIEETIKEKDKGIFSRLLGAFNRKFNSIK